MYRHLKLLSLICIIGLLPLFHYQPTVTNAFLSMVGSISCDTTDYQYEPTPKQEGTTRFAVIGDYGNASEESADVASLVASWQPDFVITTGDNNYDDGKKETIDQNIGQFYEQFIGNYHGAYGDGAMNNRFFPVLGNHDTRTEGGAYYLSYLTLPGNERYYDFVWGNVQFFALNSSPGEPDGVTESSQQAKWLQDRLASSTAQFKIVYMHHPPYSSGMHGSSDYMQWPFHEWGADAVIAGHDHNYERIMQNGIPYFVNGLGGREMRNFPVRLDTDDGSVVRYNCDYGAMLVEVGDDTMSFSFITRSGLVVDHYSISAPLS
jgi:predicted phosphodiesterase